MKTFMAGTLGAVVAAAIFIAGIMCGIGYSVGKQWIAYSLFNQQLGETSMHLIALGMLDASTPEDTRKYLSTMLAYKVISLDMTLPQTGFGLESITNGIIASVARHNEKYPLIIDDHNLKEILENILAKAKKEE